MHVLRKSHWRKTASAACLIGAIVAAGDVAAQSRIPDIFSIGRNSLGESCTAQFDKKDTGLADTVFDQSWSLNCRSSVASRKAGTIRRVENSSANIAAIEATLSCGDAQAIKLAKVGQARARRCVDKTLNSQTVVVDFVRGRTAYYGSAGLSLAGPLEQGLGIASRAVPLAGAELGQVKASFAPETLVAGDAAKMAEAGDVFNAENALRQGIRLNQQGLHQDASRQLNDAISRLEADAPGELRGQLELEAALADSNIGLFRSADSHFARARELMVGAANPLLQRKTTSYEALHEINRRQFRTALTKLDGLSRENSAGVSPLRDPVTLARVNQPPRNAGAGVSTLGSDDTAALQQRIVDAVVDWARSAALLALGDTDTADTRIKQARRSFDVVRGSRIDVSQSLWLESRIERQAGRIAARRSDWTGAVAAFDRAIAVLREAQARNPGLGSSEVAAAQLERADILARQGAGRETVMREFAIALDSVSAAAGGGVDPTSIERYLDLLANGTDGSADPESAERFFRAVQLVSNPQLARQIAQLQSVVSTDPALASQFRERTEVDTELRAVRYGISQGGADTAALEARRRVLEQQLQQLDDALATNVKFRATDDTPATIAEVRKTLREGETYFKFATLKRGAFGIVVTRDEAFVYRAPTASAKLMTLANQLRASILLTERRTLPVFKVGLSHQLYNGIAGAAASRLAGAVRLVVDPSGPLETVPIGVLVSDKASVDRFVARPRAKVGGYEDIAFLAAAAEISTALSPRSFIVSRSQPASRAPRSFIGFGQHSLPTTEMLNAVISFKTRTGCLVDGPTLDESYQFPGYGPISGAELSVAANALGDPQAPIVTGSEFSDKALMARGDLSQYGVVHFATHGFTEGGWIYCERSPPSLLTSLGPGQSDGILSFDEIAGLNLDANLVFLAACDTAVGIKDEELARASGLEQASGSLEGLVRSFLTANARAVVATSWVVPDVNARTLVARFYEKGRTSDIGAALREGQLALMRESATSHPFRWGAFFVVGDASKPLISATAAAANGGRAPVAAR